VGDVWDWVQQAIEHNREANNGLVLREDGWCYAIDYALYLQYAARMGDRDLFESLIEGLERVFLVSSQSDTNSDGSITWRVKPGQDREATGVAESVAFLAGLFEAHRRWPDIKTERLIHTIFNSYQRHQVKGFEGKWYIRDYYLYQCGSFSTTGFLFNYNPDLFFKMGELLEQKEMTTIATRSLGTLQNNHTSCGLFHLIYDPGIASHYGSSFHFSPNGLIKAADAAEIAISFATSDSERAEATLDLLQAHGFPITHWFSTKDCLPVKAENSGPGQLAVILRLSLLLGDSSFARSLLEQIETILRQEFIENPAFRNDTPNWTWDFTQILLALSYLKDS